jgi:hypothetical protein
MNNLCCDIGGLSINHYGEELCGDHIDILDNANDKTIVVLADGLGSGVKASILSTLTSKIISTLLSSGLSINDCIETIVSTLPICSVRKVAYSTFTILQIINNEEVEIIQYDNPLVLMIRNGYRYDYAKKEITINGKKVYHSTIKIQDNDVFIAMSDGVPHAGIGLTYNFGWKMEDIVSYVEPLTIVGFTAKTISTMLIEEVNRLYQGAPGDDASAVCVRIRKRSPMNILFGPPKDPNDCDRMMNLFFAKQGKHIICGGTTSSIASNYLHEPLTPSLEYINDIPPISFLNGVDLVTEGVITINKVLENAKDHLASNNEYVNWGYAKDGASMISRLLFEEATDINFYVGRAINPAHQNPDLPINFSIKMNLVNQLSECLKKMGKRINVNFF